jgi:hypothetical protein
MAAAARRPRNDTTGMDQTRIESLAKRRAMVPGCRRLLAALAAGERASLLDPLLRRRR